VVNGCGHVALAGHTLPVGSPLAGRQVIPRVEEHLVHVITDGQVCKTVPHTVPPAKRARLRGAYLPARCRPRTASRCACNGECPPAVVSK
jgi:hypothetical protein